VTSAPTAAAEPAPRGHVNFRRLLIWAVLIVVIAAAADLLGWNIRGWFSNLWDTLSTISVAYIVAGCALKTVQTGLTAFAWYSILRYAYPTTSFRVVLACYATSVALNGFQSARCRSQGVIWLESTKAFDTKASGNRTIRPIE